MEIDLSNYPWTRYACEGGQYCPRCGEGLIKVHICGVFDEQVVSDFLWEQRGVR